MALTIQGTQLRLSHFKWKGVIAFFLIICALSVNHIIIYNEELLVACSFFLFVSFVSYSYGNKIQDFFDANGVLIQEMSASVTNSREQQLQQLFKEFKKSVEYTTAFLELQALFQKHLKGVTFARSTLQNTFSQQIQSLHLALSESQESLFGKVVTGIKKKQSHLVITNCIKKENKNNKKKGKCTPSLGDAIACLRDAPGQ